MCLDVREWLELGLGGALSCDSMDLPPEEGRGMDLSTQQLGERQWLSAELRGEWSTPAGKALCVSSCLRALTSTGICYHSSRCVPFDTACSNPKGALTSFMSHLHNHSKDKNNQTLSKK